MKNVYVQSSVRRIVIIGLLGGFTAVLGMTPLGFIPVGPTRATIMHLPVIIGAIMEGPIVGGLVGLIFGLFSMFQAVTNPTPVSFVFLNPLVSLLPRVLIGITSYYVHRLVKGLANKKTIWLLNSIWVGIFGYLTYGIYVDVKNFQRIGSIAINLMLLILTVIMIYYTNSKLKKESLEIIIPAVMGTLTNTIGVLLGIYILYGERFVKELGYSIDMTRKVIVGIGITNGIPEAIISIIIVTNVVAALKRRNY